MIANESGTLRVSSGPTTVPRWVHVAGGLTLGAYGMLTWASHHLAHRTLLLTLFACMAVAWTSALLLAFRGPSLGRESWRWMVAYAVAFRALGFLGQPLFEDDFYRFLWDGQVFARRGNPYGIAPSAFFSDSTLGETFENILTQVSFPHLPTVYGPVFEVAFLAAYAIAPGSLWSLKLILIGAELGAFAAMRRGMEPRAALLWLWCPLCIQETAFSAHPDMLGIAAVAMAFSASRAGRHAWAGGFLGLAIGARPFALVLLPFLVGGNPRRSLLAVGMTTLAVHLPWVLGTNASLEGLTRFALGWEFNSAGFALLQAGFGTTPAKVLGAALFMVGYTHGLLRWWKRGRVLDELPVATVWGLLFLVSPVVNPWYLQWMVPFVAVRPRAWSLALLAMVTVSYATNQNLGIDWTRGFNHPGWVRPLEFGVVGGVAFVAWMRQRSGSTARRGASPA